MKKILLSLILILATFTTFAQQNVGDVSNMKLKNSAGTKDDVWRTGHAQNTYDTAVAVWLSPLKLKTDSIYTRLGAGISVTGTFYQATQPVSIDTSTYLKKSIKVSELPSITIANTAFTANAGTNLNTSALALESGGNLGTIVTNTSNLKLAQGSPTSGQVGNLPLTATTTSAPTYTTAQSNPFSTNTSGELRVNYAAGATAAKQPALGVAGTPSADVISVQGVSGGRPVIIDGSGVTQPISIAAPTLIYHNKKTVTTAGTRVVLAASQAVRSVCIKALITNTGYIYIGDASLSSTTGFQLLAGDSVSLDISNLSTIYIDSSVSGEGVTYISSN